MATAQHRAAYRALVREVNRAVRIRRLSFHLPRPLRSPVIAPTASPSTPRATRPNTVAAYVRAIFEERRDGDDNERFFHDMRNAATFMRSQRMHKTLLERYNPLLGLSTEERVKKTAHRVGLDMPISPKDEE